MPDSNEALFDAANRHQTYLIRYGGATARRAIKLIEKAEADLVTRIADRVDRLGPTAASSLGSKRLKAILKALREQNRDLMAALHRESLIGFTALARQEVDIANRRLNEAIGVDLNNFKPSPEELRTLVQHRGIGGQSLRRWWTRLGRDRLGRLESAVNLGIIEGDTIQQITRRFRNAENTTRRAAETLVRTHVNHVANQARNELYKANDDIIEGVRWTATLDGRTSAICQSRDGEVYPLDSGPRPPAHPNCRSIMSPVLKSWAQVAKPGALKQGRGARDFDRLFEKNLKKQGFTKNQLRHIKRDTRASMNGQVPKKQTYQTWLKRQPVEFQNDVLGPTRAKLFREGGLSLDRFIEPTTGAGLTLDEIKSRNKEAWMSAVGKAA